MHGGTRGCTYSGEEVKANEPLKNDSHFQWRIFILPQLVFANMHMNMMPTASSALNRGARISAPRRHIFAHISYIASANPSMHRL